MLANPEDQSFDIHVDSREDWSDFDQVDYGMQLTPELDAMVNGPDGAVILVTGLRGPVTMTLPDGKPSTVVSLLFKFLDPADPPELNDWGMWIGSTSPAIQRASTQLRAKAKPFPARIIKVKGRSYPYWNLERVQIQYDSNGNMVVPKENGKAKK